ncbi:MAG TPA: hypothetical protein VGM05_30970 [Planctomycetaceae bacterium]|jgi:hypothetical protein
MSDKPAKQTSERKTFEKLPIIFHFQPTSYEVITPERLPEWEKVMRERVGIAGDGTVARGPTFSFCGGAPGLDPCDSDYIYH